MQTNRAGLILCSGVLLFDLDAMRSSELYNSLLTDEAMTRLTAKYQPNHLLRDEDFFTLISIDYDELLYTLPAGWNRQLCRRWKDRGLEDVYDEFFKCDEVIHCVHGNHYSDIPEFSSKL